MCSEPPVTWAALRQVHALRESVVWCLAGIAVPSDEVGLAQWLTSQGLNSGQDGFKAASIRIQRAISDALWQPTVVETWQKWLGIEVPRLASGENRCRTEWCGLEERSDFHNHFGFRSAAWGRGAI